MRRPCPFCAEWIQDAAVVCRFCGRDVLPLRPASTEMPRSSLTSVVWVAAAAVLVLLLGIGLLYAYRAQSPAAAIASYDRTVAEIRAGHVSRVTISGDTATIEKTDGSRETTALGSDHGAFERVVLEYNATQPNNRIALTTQQSPPSAGVVGSIILSLLPLVLLAVLIVWVVRAVVRAIDRR
ncbi:MAG TPA: hypothetical protein VGT60_01620 [Candidatus Limnocylindria bacterium]|nr:hypothetical protein [Candidatus Limnocylindria bacterium]